MVGMAKKKPARSRSSWPDRLKAIREASNLTQAEAAARIHVSQALWARWENGSRGLSAAHQLLIELVFGKSEE